MGIQIFHRKKITGGQSTYEETVNVIGNQGATSQDRSWQKQEQISETLQMGVEVGTVL